MLLRVGIYSIFLIMMLVKCILPDEKPEIIPLPQQSVLDKGDFIFDPTTLISVENEKQAMIAQELTGIFNQAAGFSPQIAIQEKQADIIFRTDMSLSADQSILYSGRSFRKQRIFLRNTNFTLSASSGNKQPNTGKKHSMECSGNDYT